MAGSFGFFILMCGSPNIEPRPFELVIPFPLVISFPNPFELAPPEPLTASVWVAICVMVGKDELCVGVGSDFTVVDWVVVDGGADVVDGVGWGVPGCNVNVVCCKGVDVVLKGVVLDILGVKSD